MTLPLMLLTTAGAVYLTAFFFHLAAFLGFSERAGRWGFVLTRTGFLIHTFFFFLGTKTEGFLIPVSSFGQVMAFFSWALAFVYLVLLARIHTESFGVILAPLLSLLVGLGLFRFHAGQTSLPTPLNPYFILHLGTAFFAYASLTLSFVAAVLYLVQHHELKRRRGGTFYHQLPSLESLEGLIYQPMAWGVFLLTLAMGVGFLWAKSTCGTYWLGDPKTISTLLVTLFYGVLIYLHYARSLRGKRLAVLNLVAFAFIFLNFFGLNLFGKGVHQLLQ